MGDPLPPHLDEVRVRYRGVIDDAEVFAASHLPQVVIQSFLGDSLVRTDLAPDAPAGVVEVDPPGAIAFENSAHFLFSCFGWRSLCRYRWAAAACLRSQ